MACTSSPHRVSADVWTIQRVVLTDNTTKNLGRHLLTSMLEQQCSLELQRVLSRIYKEPDAPFTFKDTRRLDHLLIDLLEGQIRFQF
jgi:hypothetical protein